MKKILASILAAFFVVLSPISAYASTTESMMIFSMQQDEYAVQPLDLYTDDEIISISTRTAIGDYDLNSWTNSASGGSFDVISNTRFDASSGYITDPHFYIDSLPDYTNAVRFTISLSNSNGNDWLYADLLGLELDVHGLFFVASYHTDNDYVGNYIYSGERPLKARYRSYRPDGSLLTSGDININNFSISDSCYLDFHLSIPASSTVSDYACSKLDIYFDYNLKYLPTVPFDAFVSNVGFRAPDSYLYGDFPRSNSSSSSQDDYNKNVEAELGNIQTGINNVVNSVMQMGQQAWQGAQQTVQAVTQMTQQLNTAIDQQRQDILQGLGLLGDDIDNTMNNVKTEISNMSTSISNKLESTTESITNKIESTTETITNTIETKVDQVTTAVDNVKQSVTEVKQSILDLPNKIKDMLLGLIVPDSDTMADKYSEFSGLLEEKLGVIYQIPMMLFDFFDTIVNAATMPQSTLTLPAFRLPWIDGSQLTIWNSMEYKIIPDGLEVLSDLIRTVTSMTVVVLTFNSVKQAYERFLRS